MIRSMNAFAASAAQRSWQGGTTAQGRKSSKKGDWLQALNALTRVRVGARCLYPFLIDGPDEIEGAWLVGKRTIGVTAGASAPELLVQQVIKRLKKRGANNVHEYNGIREEVMFSLPREIESL